MLLRKAFLGALFLLSTGTASAAQRFSDLAPADEYFGRMRMSILGIANTIRDAGAHLDRGADPASVIDGSLSFAEDAIRDWQRHYPRDPWIPRDLAALRSVYERARTPRGAACAQRVALWLERDYAR